MYDKFEEWMIGQSVMETSSGDSGTIDAHNRWNSVWVNWDTGDFAGMRLHIGVRNLTFLSNIGSQFEEITIDGKRYKLVPIE